MNLREKTLSGVLWSTVEKWGGKTFSLLTFLLLARLLEPEVFGLVALATVFTAFVQVFVDQGFSEAIIQKDDLEPEHLNTAFWVNVAFGVVMTLAGMAAAGPVAHLLGEPRLESIIRWLALAFTFTGLGGVQMALCRREMTFKLLAARTLIANLAGGVVGVGMALAGYGVWSLVAQTLVTSALEALVLWLASDWRPGLRVSRRHFDALFTFGVHVMGINVLNFAIRRSDDLLIGYFLGPTALGYYAVAYRILTTLTDLLTNVTSRVAFPVFSRMQKEPERLLRAFYTMTRYTAFVAFPVFVGLAAAAPEIIPVVFGEVWRPSIPVMQVLPFVGLLHSVTYFNSSVIMAMGRPGWMLKLSLASAVANVVAFAIAVQWGIVAVAAAYVIRTYAFFPVGPYLLRKLISLRFSTYLRQFAVPLVASAAIVATVGGLRALMGQMAGSPFLGLAIVSSAVVYVLVVLLLARPVLEQAWSLVQSARVGRGSLS